MTSSAIADIYELSPMQTAMLFHAVHSPEAGTSFNQLSCRIRGDLEPTRFREAWQRLVDRHCVLRTSFHWEESAKPLQVVHSKVTLPWLQEDWREWADAEQRARWSEFLERDRAAGFVLDRAPLMRCRLARVADGEYLFNWSHHHLLSDGWCLSLVMEEVFQLYGHLTRGLALSLPVVRPYREYIQWLQRQNVEGAQQHWKRYLKGFRSPTPMPARAEPGERFGAATTKLHYELSEDLSAQLRRFASQHSLTLNTLVQGAWALLLARYTGETDIVFGATVSGRPTDLPGVETMIGNFINTVPVRAQVDLKQPLVLWLKMLQARVAARSAFDYTPLPDIQRCSEVPLATPLFESNVIFMNYPLDQSLAQGAHGLRIDELSLYDRADVPVELQVTAQERWKIELSFDPQRFEQATMQRMLGHVAALLEHFLTDATQPLGRLSVLTSAEHREIVERFNNTAVPFDADDTVVHRLQKIAAETPDRIAIECNEVTLSAQALNARANRLARRLLAVADLQPDDLVAICAHRSERMVEAILAIWKCGAAYVPIDPEYPPARIRTVLEDARPKIIITASGLLSSDLRGLAPIVELDEPVETSTAIDDRNLDRPLSPSSLAYVIYTSGSTGKPKGAMIEHAGMLNHMLAEIDELAIGPASAVAQNASHCFDISVWQFFSGPLVGGRTVIFSNDVVLDATRFLERLQSSRIDILEVVPSYLSVLLERPLAERNALARLQTILITGEMLNPGLLARWFTLFPNIPVVNAYGPAEAADDIAQHKMTEAPDTAYVPVGKPIRNIRIYVRSELGAGSQVNLCPIGVPGEICVSGIGVGRGYLNDEATTQAAFFPDPFQPGVRMYRTGDTGCWLPDGTLLMLGRKDQQVKVNGHRIELGEIENALMRLAPISQAAVIEHQASLCAYVAFRSGSAMTEAEMRSALSSVLPEYMLPRAYVILDGLPLSRNGKVDRKALPSPDSLRQPDKAHYAPPRSAVETRLCEIWGEVLGIPAPGIHENLFALGGDSILSMRIVALARKKGLKISTRQVFQHPTIAELAAVAVTAQSQSTEWISSSGPLPLTPVQRSFFQHSKADQNQYNQAVLLEVPAALNVSWLHQALRHAAQIHDALRLRFHREDNRWIQQVAPDLDIPVTASEISTDQLAAHIEALHASLNITDGPVIRAHLFRFGSNAPARLLLVAHHLIIDGVSWSVLLETLYSTYTRLGAGEKPEMPDGAASWTQWTQAMAEWARSRAIEDDLPHWQALARFSPPSLPQDHEAPASANTVASAEEVLVDLSPSATAALLTSAPRAYDAKINDLLLTALALTVNRWTGASSVLLDLESHGREELLPRLDISRTVGWFTSVFPVLLQIEAGQKDLTRVIATVKEQLRAVPTHGMSYGWLRDEIEDSPQAALSFNYLGQTDHVLNRALAWKPAAEPSGDGRSANQQREHLLDINSYVTDSRLRVAVEFSRHFHDRQTIQQLAQDYLEAIESLVAHAETKTDAYELTPVQQGMLFHSLYDPLSDVYFSSLSCRIDGALDHELFRRAWSAVVERHGVLRTSFHWEGVERPVQIVHRDVALPWREEDLSALDAEEAELRWQSFLNSDRARPFLFTQAPLIRLTLFRMGRDAWRFNWSQHHILLDGWSSALLMSEVISIYEAWRQGNTPRLETPPAFREHVAWLRQQDFEAAEQFWRSKLSGFDTPTPLMLGRPEMEGAAKPGKHQEETHLLAVDETQSLIRFAQAHHFTLNTLAQAAWALLLSRYSGEEDLIFGTIVSGRPASLAGSERMVGLFINSLPVRVQVTESSLAPWLSRLQLDLAQQEEYAYFPLADIQKLAELPAGTPLFESLLIFQNYPADEAAGAALSELRFSDFQVFDPNNYPLTLVITPGERLSVRALFDSGRFDRDTITRLLRHFAQLITSFAAAGDQSIRSLPVLTDAERHQIIEEWGNTAVPVLWDRTVLDLIETVARSHPERVAVRCGAIARTYREISLNSDRIARRLRDVAAIQPEDRVAIVMPRSEAMVETILAIWKCGAAYVPIDPAYPPARIESILSGAQPKFVVTPDFPLSEIASDVSEPFTSRCQPASLAYVIFTSGSTGKPKGAMLEQRGMLNHVLSMAQELKLSATSTVAQTASHCSDISVWQFFAALISGGQTVIYPDATILQPARLIDRIRENGVTALQLVPSYLSVFLEELEKRDDPAFPDLKMLVTIGETLQPSAVRTWFRLNPDVRLMNAYGPTEASDSVSHFIMDRPPDLPSIPIGKAIQNLRLYILDRHLNLCPIGVKGEICIAGIGVGRGYLFDEARTRAVFGVDPFKDGPDARLYHTGDIGCFTADGDILFFGRRDFQVKIRGYRIELGEIETAITGLQGITNAVVVAREEQGGNRSLIGYAVGAGWTAAELRQALREKIPAYMIPDVVMILPALPVTPNGKINRAALPRPEAPAREPVASAAPRTATERTLTRIFAEILSRESIGLDDNFFDLGGQSLKAIQMLSRIRGELSREIAVVDIFNAPTPRALAQKLEDAGAVHEDVIPALPLRPWYIASHAQKRIWLASRGADSSAYNMAGALQIEGPLDSEQLSRALASLVDRHESLRTVFAMIEGELKQKILTRENAGFRLERLSLETELDAVMREEASLPFDLASGPLFRARLIQLSAQTHVLLLTLHHIVADAWSIRILTEELRALYASNPLPPLTIQYRDYAEWHSVYLRGEKTQAHRAYWLEKLAPPVPRLEFPIDHVRPPRLSHVGRSLDLALTGSKVAALAALARTHQTSLYTVVLSSICVLLHRYTGSEDMVIGSAHAGRDREQLESQIGVFLNTVVLRIPLQKSMTLEEVIRAVSKASSEALEHGAYPFDLLLEDLRVRTPANRFPLFDIQVDYIPALETQQDSRITDLAPTESATKFDLSFHITEERDRLLIRFIYNASLFKPETIVVLRERLTKIQDAFSQDPHVRIDRISLAGAATAPKRKVRVALRLKQ